MRAGADRMPVWWPPPRCTAQTPRSTRPTGRPLAGKSVLIWPDRDAPGWDYADRASQAILHAGATTVAILVPPDDKPEGWDAADAIPDGFDVAGFLAVGERMPVMRSVEEIAAAGFADGHRLDVPRTDCRLAFTRRYGRGLALLRAVGQVAGVDGRALECRSDALRLASGPRHLPQCVAQGGQPTAQGQAGQLGHDLGGRENRPLRSEARVQLPRSGMPTSWALNTPGGVVDLRTGRMRAHRRDDRMTKVSHRHPAGRLSNVAGVPGRRHRWRCRSDRLPATDGRLLPDRRRPASTRCSSCTAPARTASRCSSTC